MILLVNLSTIRYLYDYIKIKKVWMRYNQNKLMQHT